MKLSDALRKAQGIGLDLVEIAPTANPPVCKIVALGKFRYDISKHTKDKKPASSKLKENKVRVQLQFRGREIAAAHAPCFRGLGILHRAGFSSRNRVRRC